MSSSTETITPEEDYSFSHAHGTVMVFAWMIFAPVGILFARYGRLLRIGSRRKLLGDTIWFQVHRLALSLTSVASLIGFFLVLVQTKSQWVDINYSKLLYSHSILGILVVVFALVQVWMALFRCHPDSNYRFIFNWIHRAVGVLAFILSVPTIFTVAYWWPAYHNGLVTILSLWTAWVVIVVVLFEYLEYRSQKLRITSISQHQARAITHHNHQHNGDITIKDEDIESDTINTVKLILLCVNVVISIGLAIPLIVLIWR